MGFSSLCHDSSYSTKSNSNLQKYYQTKSAQVSPSGSNKSKHLYVPKEFTKLLNTKSSKYGSQSQRSFKKEQFRMNKNFKKLEIVLMPDDYSNNSDQESVMSSPRSTFMTSCRS